MDNSRDVIPAKAGIQEAPPQASAEFPWMPACAGMTKRYPSKLHGLTTTLFRMRQTQVIDDLTFAPAQTGPWRLESGAEVQAEGVFFRVWAPKCQRVDVVVEDDTEHPFPLASETGGYFSDLVSHLTAGALYWYRLDGAVLGPDALVLRFFGDEETEGTLDRLLIVNLGCDLEYVPAPEPLLAPVKDGWWRVQWSSDDPRYGGPGIIKPYRGYDYTASLYSPGYFTAELSSDNPIGVVASIEPWETLEKTPPASHGQS
jgi:hypothetical protein